MKKMRLLSLLLAGVMVLSLAACSKEETQDTPPQQQNEQKDKSPQKMVLDNSGVKTVIEPVEK